MMLMLPNGLGTLTVQVAVCATIPSAFVRSGRWRTLFSHCSCPTAGTVEQLLSENSLATEIP